MVRVFQKVCVVCKVRVVREVCVVRVVRKVRLVNSCGTSGMSGAQSTLAKCAWYAPGHIPYTRNSEKMTPHGHPRGHLAIDKVVLNIGYRDGN